MLYTFVCQDVENSLAKRLNVRPAHVARLVELQEQGRLIAAGPNPAIDSDDPPTVLAEFRAKTER